jgi:hypothetical protein
LTELALCICARGEFGGAALVAGLDPGVAYSPSSHAHEGRRKRKMIGNSPESKTLRPWFDETVPRT